MQQLPLDLIRAPAPSLDNYVIGPNAEAVDVIGQIADGQAPARIVYLSGPAGSGKSHLLAAVAAQPGFSWFGEHATRTQGCAPQTSARGWLVDNISALSDDLQQELFNLINLMRSDDTGCLLVSDRLRASRLPIREDLRTRLASGLVIGLELLSDEQIMFALRQHAGARGLSASDAVLNWLLTRQRRDIRHLMAYLDAVDRYALQVRRQLTVPLLREFERKQGSGPPTDKIDAQP